MMPAEIDIVSARTRVRVHFFRCDAPTTAINGQRPLTRVQAPDFRAQVFPTLRAMPGPSHATRHLLHPTPRNGLWPALIRSSVVDVTGRLQQTKYQSCLLARLRSDYIPVEKD